MSTIVVYTDTIPPQNQFPERIVSPPHSGSCCFTRMEVLGTPQADGRWVYQTGPRKLTGLHSGPIR